MKLKYEFVLTELADNIVAMPIGEGIGIIDGFLKMNDIGGYIFNMLKDDVTEEDIVISMVRDYPDDTEEEIREVVDDFISTLKENDLLA